MTYQSERNFIPRADTPDHFLNEERIPQPEGSDTRQEAETKREKLPHPHNWYVWQMNDGRWHVSLMTNREP